MGLSKELAARGFVPDPKRVKLVRHASKRLNVRDLHAQGWIETYQAYQSQPIFDGCDQIVAFLGENDCKSRFLGVYDVGQRQGIASHPVPPRCPPEVTRGTAYHYTLTKRAGFSDIEDHLVIDWGKAARTWHQWFSDRRIV